MSEAKERLKEMLISDVISSRRTADTLREAFVGALLAKTAEMSPEQILSAIERVDKTPIKSYQDVLGMIDNS
jgi:hypothetical protein